MQPQYQQQQTNTILPSFSALIQAIDHASSITNNNSNNNSPVPTATNNVPLLIAQQPAVESELMRDEYHPSEKISAMAMSIFDSPQADQSSNVMKVHICQECNRAFSRKGKVISSV